MYSLNIALRRNFLPRSQHLKPLAVLWRSQKTEASALQESSETFCDSTKPAEIESVADGVRPFEEIPGPKVGLKFMLDSYVKSEGFTKAYRLANRLFAEHGPIFRENLLMGSQTVHVIDPTDFEKVFRAEGKYPQRPPIDVWIEHRKRMNHFPGVFVS